MLPVNLKAEQFAAYPPLARGLAVAHLGEIRQLPLGFAPSLLGEIIDYDYKFPAEREAIDRELANLARLTPAQSSEWFRGFGQLRLSAVLEEFDWVNQPAQFVSGSLRICGLRISWTRFGLPRRSTETGFELRRLWSRCQFDDWVLRLSGREWPRMMRRFSAIYVHMELTLGS